MSDSSTLWSMNSFSPITTITSESELESYHNSVLSMERPKVAMDLEGEFNLHCYGEHLCLVQIFDGTQIVMIDPMAFKDWKPLQRFFEDPKIEKVVYDRSSDAALLYNKYQISYNNTLDLRVAVALLEHPKQGLSSVLEATLGIVGENKKKFQRYNWMTRPIQTDALRYAAEDVIYLFQLEDELFRQLEKRKLLDEFYKENQRLCDAPIRDNRKNRHKKAKGFRHLNKRQQERFSKLFYERDRIAQLVNLPPDRVFKNQKLMDWCKRDVYSKEAASKSISARVSQKDRDSFVEILTSKQR